MRVGVIGAGGIAWVHMPLILQQPNTTVVGIADRDRERAQRLGEEFGVHEIYPDAAALIAEQRPDVVHVLTPPEDHASTSVSALKNGCHVLVEKPMALTMSEAREMVDAARGNDRLLCVDHNLLFDDAVRRARKIIAGGAIGDVVTVESRFSYNANRNPAFVADGAQHVHWAYRLNGGPLQDLVPHPASLVLEFLPEVGKISHYACNRGVLPEPWPDELRVLLGANGVTGLISVSLSERPDTIMLCVRGTRGTIHADLFNNLVTWQRTYPGPRALARGLSGPDLTWQHFRGTIRNAFKVATRRLDKSQGVGPLITRFYRAIESGGDTPVPAETAFRVVRLIDELWPAPVRSAVSTPPPTGRSAGASVALVTGASGFIGTHLVKCLLSAGVAVRALVRPNSIHGGKLRKLDIETVEGDLADRDAVFRAMSGVATVYHVGAATNNSWKDHEAATIRGTQHVIAAALSNDVSHVVHVSTLAVYELLDLPRSVNAITEDSPYQKKPRRMGPYAYAKTEAEKRMLQAHREEGLPVTVVRPGIVIGVGGRIFFPHLGYRSGDKLFLVIGKGDVILPLTSVENTVNALVAAARTESAIGKAYNLVDDGEVSVRLYIDEFIRVTGTPARVIHLPYILPYAATTGYEIAAALRIVRKGLTSRAQFRWKQARVRFLSDRAKKDLGWTTEVPIHDSMGKAFERYRCDHQ